MADWIYFLHPPRDGFAASMTDEEKAVFARHFEYLELLRQLGDEAFAKRSVRRLVRSGYEIERDVGVWEQTRSEMASRLAVLWRKRMADSP